MLSKNKRINGYALAHKHTLFIKYKHSRIAYKTVCTSKYITVKIYFLIHQMKKNKKMSKEISHKKPDFIIRKSIPKHIENRKQIKYYNAINANVHNKKNYKIKTLKHIYVLLLLNNCDVNLSNE